MIPHSFQGIDDIAESREVVQVSASVLLTRQVSQNRYPAPPTPH